jgi:protocatechuate 3,4-dioxygenase beta subunit
MSFDGHRRASYNGRLHSRIVSRIHIDDLNPALSLLRMDEHRKLSRRETLLAAGGLIAAALIPEAASAAGSGPAAVATGAISCVLTPEMTEGPYYVPHEKVRRNITDGKPGAPLELRLTVVDASACKPIKGAVVDIWHADALGAYSGAVANDPGKNFLRGVQKTDRNGLALFESIYPGWYPGRAVHIHVKVHLGGNVVHTGQFFFNDALTDSVYTRSPYNTRPSRDIRNGSDSIYRNGGSRSLLRVTKPASGYRGAITMGVHRG